MHRKATGHKSWTLSLVSSQPSVADSSPSSSPVPQELAFTLTSIRETGTNTMNLISGWPKKSVTARQLSDVLCMTLATCDMLNTTEELDAETLYHLHYLNTILLDVQRDVMAEVRPRKREIMKFLGKTLPDPFPSCQTRVLYAFRALESQFTFPPSVPMITSQPVASTSAIGEASPPPPSRPGWSHHAKTALDILETGFQLAVGVGEAVPVGWSIGSIGQTIIKILNGVVNNKEEAQSLADYVQDLVATANHFMETGTQLEGETMKKLMALKDTLTSVHGELEKFKAQGGFWQGMSHIRNKEVLAGCDTQIRRSFTQFQVHLSLDAVLLLTSLGDTDARRECDRLLDRLGNAETGATDKASDPADLMCLNGTRVELLAEMDEWATNPSSHRVLWINGIAGCGKSAIAATFASRREEQSATVIFHFSRSNQSRNKRVICSIARQLAQKVVRGTGESPVHLVMDNVKAKPDIADMHLSTQFKHLLVDPLSQLMPDSPPVLVIIDALDEWDNEDAASKLVHMIHDHNSKLPAYVKFILTSRKESHLSQALSLPRITSLVKELRLDTVPRATVDQDIRAYLTKHFDQIRSSFSEPHRRTWPERREIDMLVKLSGGSFQWASTAIRFVAEGAPEVRLNEVLGGPDQFGNPDELCKRVLRTLLASNKNPSIPTLLQHVLGSIVVAPTPVSLDILAYLYASGHDTLNSTTSDIKEILAALGYLLNVPLLSKEAIRVLHPSTIAFLTDQERCTDQRLYADPVAQHRRLALLCLDQMQRDLRWDICRVGDTRTSKTDSEVRKLVPKHIPEPLRYACRYWAEHLLASGVTNNAELDVPLRNFCTIYMLFWFEVMSLTDMLKQAVAAIEKAEQWLKLCPAGSANSTFRALFQDASRFLSKNSELITANALQIYLLAASTVD